jgi:hypothetical protein
MQVVPEQQAASIPVTDVTEVPHVVETPMDVDREASGSASGTKRKAEEVPSEESKKARVGGCSIASRSRRHGLNSIEHPQVLKRFAQLPRFLDA